ncbi:hypothetical protein P8C59_005748 [Phyllachora maydis]|nr:hypothetical protein P8C59_005748 [Phyllachora maydis]
MPPPPRHRSPTPAPPRHHSARAAAAATPSPDDAGASGGFPLPPVPVHAALMTPGIIHPDLFLPPPRWTWAPDLAYLGRPRPAVPEAGPWSATGPAIEAPSPHVMNLVARLFRSRLRARSTVEYATEPAEPSHDRVSFVVRNNGRLTRVRSPLLRCRRAQDLRRASHG